MDVDLGAVVEGDLDLEGVAVVVRLRIGDLPAARVRQRGVAGLLELLARERGIGVVAGPVVVVAIVGLIGLIGLVALVADDAVVGVELDVELAAVVEGDLDLVQALLVALLGVGDPPSAGVVERGRAGPFELLARDGAVVTVGSAGGRPRDTTADDGDPDDGRGGDGDPRAVLHLCSFVHRGRPSPLARTVRPHG